MARPAFGSASRLIFVLLCILLMPCHRLGSFFSFVTGADHLLAQPRVIALVEEMKLNALFPDRRVQLYRYIFATEMYVSLPDRPACHKDLQNMPSPDCLLLLVSVLSIVSQEMRRAQNL